ALLQAFVVTGLPAFGKGSVVAFFAASLKTFFVTLLTAFHQSLFQPIVVGFTADIFQLFSGRECQWLALFIGHRLPGGRLLGGFLFGFFGLPRRRLGPVGQPPRLHIA